MVLVQPVHNIYFFLLLFLIKLFKDILSHLINKNLPALDYNIIIYILDHLIDLQQVIGIN